MKKYWRVAGPSSDGWMAQDIATRLGTMASGDSSLACRRRLPQSGKMPATAWKAVFSIPGSMIGETIPFFLPVASMLKPKMSSPAWARWREMSRFGNPSWKHRPPSQSPFLGSKVTVGLVSRLDSVRGCFILWTWTRDPTSSPRASMIASSLEAQRTFGASDSAAWGPTKDPML